MTDVSTKPKTKKPKPPVPMPPCAADYEPRDIRWLWYPYVARGLVTMLEGDPGLGKSWITYALAADLSSGRALPGQKTPLPPQNVFLMNAEDMWQEVVIPRLIAQDADRFRIFTTPAAVGQGNFMSLSLEGIKDVEAFVQKCAATIVFIDPLVAYLGGKLDMNKANEVREVMGELARLAVRTNSAVICVRHLRKGSGDGNGKAIYAGLGSIDFTASVRSVLAVAQTKGGQRIVRHIKSNIGPHGVPLVYTIEEHNGVSRFNWGGIYDGDDQGHPCQTSHKREEAELFLFDLLRDGACPALDIHERARDAGISITTLKRAKAGIAESVKTGDEWVWMLKDGLQISQTSSESTRPG